MVYTRAMRLAGSKGHYTFAVIDATTGDATSYRFELPSVTHILHGTLARPALERWMYRQTVESVEHLLESYADGGIGLDEVLAHDLDALLAENGLRPLDVRDAAAKRGTNAHNVAEALATGCFGGHDEQTWWYSCCPGEAGVWDRYTAAAERWFTETQPAVICAEVPVWSLSLAYAGTVDLVWYGGHPAASMPRVLTDFKTHDPAAERDGGPAYDVDRIQAQAYACAWDEMHTEAPIRATSVVLLGRDGTYVEDTKPAPQGAWEAVLSMYRRLGGR